MGAAHVRRRLRPHGTPLATQYGSLNHRRRQEGGSIRFGSAHLRLAGHTLARRTFCYPDSVYEPSAFGDAQHMGLADLADADHRDLLDDCIEAHVQRTIRVRVARFVVHRRLPACTL